MTLKDNSYSRMQRAYYNAQAENWSIDNKGAIVGSWDAQNIFEGYENLWKGFETSESVALDWACGPGRNIELYHSRFKRIDGVDFARVIDDARGYLTTQSISSYLYVTDGYNLSEPDRIPSNTYDFVFSTIALQHVCVYDIRFSVLQEVFRVLKPGGWITMQMGYGTFDPPKYETVDYYANYYEATGTNGLVDTRCESPEQIKGDLDKIGFDHFSYVTTSAAWEGADGAHPNWIFFRAQKPV